LGVPSAIAALLLQQPRVVAFNTAEKWSQDVSADVAHELRYRCDLQMRDIPFGLQDFVDRYEGRYNDIQLPLPLRIFLTMAFQRKKPEKIGTKGPLPGFIEPAPATATTGVPSSERWVHEIKFDGYRVQAHRRGHDWTKRFRKIALRFRDQRRVRHYRR
jgi:hypothetical protein